MKPHLYGKIQWWTVKILFYLSCNHSTAAFVIPIFTGKSINSLVDGNAMTESNSWWQQICTAANLKINQSSGSSIIQYQSWNFEPPAVTHLMPANSHRVLLDGLSQKTAGYSCPLLKTSQAQDCRRSLGWQSLNLPKNLHKITNSKSLT